MQALVPPLLTVAGNGDWLTAKAGFVLLLDAAVRGRFGIFAPSSGGRVAALEAIAPTPYFFHQLLLPRARAGRGSANFLFRRIGFQSQGVDLAFELGGQRLVDEAVALQA